MNTIIEHLEHDGMALMEHLRPELENAMALRFHSMTMENFGDSGKWREAEWPPLSKRYALEVNRPHATLVLKGRLQASLQVPTSNVVSTDMPYAAVHQEGGGNNIPRRPFMPMTAGGKDLSSPAHEEIAKALEAKLTEVLG